MQYPLIFDYKTAVLIPETFDKFQHLKPVTDSFGQPIFAAGGPAVVFKMYDPSTNKKFALKCFLKHQNNRKEHFDAVGNYLEQIHSPYLCNYEYVEDEIWINESTFPVLVMDWIEGEMMSLHVAELCKKGDHEALSLLAGKFDALGLWLMQSDLAHCDIKPDNILVTPQGDLKLVDYDGMYVPELKGKRSPELGTAEYRHPKRTPEYFGPQLDDFPILVLSLSLHSLAKDPSLYDSTINGDALMFRREDYTSLLTCRHLPFFIANQSNEIISSRFGLLQYSLHQTIIDLKGLPEVLEKTAFIPKPLSTKVEPEDGEWIDEYGVIYSADRRKLIKCDSSYKGEYIIREGTEVICDEAFVDCEILFSLILPKSITSIGENAFQYCFDLQSLVLPDGITSIGDGAFDGCVSLIDIVVNGDYFSFEDGALYDLAEKKIICLLSSFDKQHFILPDGITSIGNFAFSGCSSLISLVLPSGIMSIGDWAFLFCMSLKSLNLPSSLTSIGYSAFSECRSLTSLNLPSSLTSIDQEIFEGCNLKSLVISYGVTSICDDTFRNCSSLESIVILEGITSIGNESFLGCDSLLSVVLPRSLTSIGVGAFAFCSSLERVIIPKGATQLRKLLLEIYIKDSIIIED